MLFLHPRKTSKSHDRSRRPGQRLALGAPFPANWEAGVPGGAMEVQEDQVTRSVSPHQKTYEPRS